MTLLNKIAANRRKQRNLTTKLEAVDAELGELVRQAFEDGHTGPAIAAVAGLSRERVYQIRDGRR